MFSSEVMNGCHLSKLAKNHRGRGHIRNSVQRECAVLIPVRLSDTLPRESSPNTSPRRLDCLRGDI